MADAILSRGNTSVSVPLLSPSRSIAVARDVGKPTLSEYTVGRQDPRARDNLNAADQFTVQGILTDGTAYADAKTLAEDLIKPRATSGTPLQLDLSALPSRGTYDVAPVSDSACTLTYQPGRRDMVGVQLSLSVVAQTFGGSQSGGGTASPDAGDGVKLERSSANASVTLAPDLRVERTIGRPDGKLQQRPADLPTYIDQNTPATDVFELTGQFGDANAESDATTLEENIVRTRLGDETLTLHFLDNLYGLDAYDVIPNGSGAVRTVFRTTETGIVRVPTLNLKVVDNSQP